MSELEKLKAECLDCAKCPLRQGARQVVFGVGNENARIMLVGEGPGEQEDIQGEPFVGKSGQLLDKYLELTGFDRNKNVYIANIVKCRPENNRDPREEEQEICIEWLRRQVKIIRPQIIVCLGRIAAQKLISPDFRVTSQHGQFIEKGGIYFMGTFHPSALLRNSANKPAALSDFQALREFARERLEIDTFCDV